MCRSSSGIIGEGVQPGPELGTVPTSNAFEIRERMLATVHADHRNWQQAMTHYERSRNVRVGQPRAFRLDRPRPQQRLPSPDRRRKLQEGTTSRPSWPRRRAKVSTQLLEKGVNLANPTTEARKQAPPSPDNSLPWTGPYLRYLPRMTYIRRLSPGALPHRGRRMISSRPTKLLPIPPSVSSTWPQRTHASFIQRSNDRDLLQHPRVDAVTYGVRTRKRPGGMFMPKCRRWADSEK